jgi:hypothetical protein
VRRPAFQFYTADWQGNSKLRRCSHAHKGAWVDVLCLMHDSDEYGVLRWPLEDIAQAVGCSVKMLREIVAKGVLKGAEADGNIEAFVFTPRHAGKDGVPVTLLPAQVGPIWYSSRMVRDEYVRTKRGEGTRFGDEPKSPPKPPLGSKPNHRLGDGPSTSSSSTTTKQTTSPSAQFLSFWASWPINERKEAKGKCFELWRKKNLDAHVDEILAHVERMKRSEGWRNGYVPAPKVYLNESRWEGAEIPRSNEEVL